MPAPAKPINQDTSPIVRLDLSHLHDLDLNHHENARLAWDTLHLAAGLQGIVNRDAAQLWLRFEIDVEDYWWNDLNKPGNWLHSRDVIDASNIAATLIHFKKQWKGAVLYAEQPWAGSNVASTIAGLEDRLPLRYDAAPGSLYQQLRTADLWSDADELRLFDEHGQPIWHDQPEPTEKTKAHRWLIEHCLRTGRVSPDHLAYYLDAHWLTRPTLDTLPNCTLTNHDYFISKRALFVDLHVWEEEAPIDDPDQPVGHDLKLLRETLKLLQQNAAGMIHVGGFTPWRWKYSDEPGAGSAHHGVQTEWKLVKEVSAYNGYLDADAISYAGMTNASFYQHFPKHNHYAQASAPTIKTLENKGSIDGDGKVKPATYVMLYTGDYDAAAWLNRLLPQWWTDPARGTIPINWALNPNLDRRAPHAMHHARVNATDLDFFIAGDCGAGYLNPAQLTAPRPDPDVPDGWDLWCKQCSEDYQRYGLTITGFIIEGLTESIGQHGLDRYATFSPGGLIAHRKLPTHGLHDSGMPYLRMTADLGGTYYDAAKALTSRLGNETTQFHAFRTVVQSPTWHAELMQHVAKSHQQVRFLDAPTFFTMLRQHLQTQTAASPTTAPVIKQKKPGKTKPSTLNPA